ncbi:MAG: DUF1963 domain-containing protein [Sphingopyxis sp.]|uniref:DUF1963 domain-containing protein n=1 Tax=Sphingopyxis sp. TaxID=1908224 RepID=UPI002AB92693|nr:DUF1963 domain-containing protein [Sphingopyxis sp.]MDZ3830539.1 DUF1963 domain-containing protein [Sphingopyxis sp.]
MDDLERAMLQLAIFTLAFLAIGAGIWWRRRPRAEPAGPTPSKSARTSGESRFSRKSGPIVEAIDIAPSRLARISGKRPADEPEPIPYHSPAAPPAVARPPMSSAPAPAGDGAFQEPAAQSVVEERLDAMAVEAAERARSATIPHGDGPTVCLVPQVPPHDAILTTSWLGGRPHLPPGTAWPLIDGREGDFLAQIGCADLPPDLWEGLGPRRGWLAIFANPDSGAAHALHLSEDGPAREPARPPGILWSAPPGAAAAFAIRAFPHWPVDLVAVRADGPDPRNEAAATDPLADFAATGYDIADPAFHPFDWDMMLAMVVLLEGQTAAPPDVDDDPNAEPRERAQDIITIVRESSGQTAFSPTDATAVMSALHAIRWTSTNANGERIELPLTRHHQGANPWIEDYLALLFDRAKHLWCAHPGHLSAPARALFEPLWEGMAAREIATIGGQPSRLVTGFDPERDLLLIDLPESRLMSRGPGPKGRYRIAMRKADLAAGDFSKLRLLSDA